MIKINNPKDKKIIFECLKASVYGPFFPDWEFSILFGLERNDIENIISDWEKININNKNVQLAINNSINNLLGYPHGISDKDWLSYISISREELKKLFKKIKYNTDNNYFKNIM